MGLGALFKSLRGEPLNSGLRLRTGGPRHCGLDSRSPVRSARAAGASGLACSGLRYVSGLCTFGLSTTFSAKLVSSAKNGSVR